MSHPPGRDEHDADLSSHAHDRRYTIFAVVFAAAVLIFAAISVSVVVLTS
jgi:hypothetical protein